VSLDVPPGLSPRPESCYGDRWRTLAYRVEGAVSAVVFHAGLAGKRTDTSGSSLYKARQTRNMAKPVFVLNGPNLNLLGVREPEIYGRETLDDVRKVTEGRAKALGLAVDFRQSNHEGELIGWIQEARTAASGIILNAGGLTHTSVGILDALSAAELPVIEVHLSNIFRRESFRHHSYVSMAAKGVICGLGVQGYEFAVEAMAKLVA
jgi:3-dehydroquinate dehydratase-2